MIRIKKNSTLQGTHGKPILADVFYDDHKKSLPVVIFCHGYKGFKDWGAWNEVAHKFAQAGLFFIKFNFSHNGGTVEQPMDFPDLNAFGQNNYIKELDDLDTVLNWITSPDFDYKESINLDDITIIGHSRGGGITALKTAEDSRVSRLITWASVSDYESRFPKGAAFKKWRDTGIYYVENGRTKQQMPHEFQFYTSFIENKERLTISRAVSLLTVPHLIIHGTEDPTVSITEAEDLQSYNPNSELYTVPGADHVFGARHPWNDEQLPPDLATIVKKSIEFTRL